MRRDSELMFTPNRNCSPDFAPINDGDVVSSEQCERCGNVMYIRRGDVMTCVTDQHEKDTVGYEGCGAGYRIREETLAD